MDVTTARALARADALTCSVQKVIWHTGDQLARSSVAARADLCDDLARDVLTGGDQRLLASWSRATRAPEDVFVACQAAEEHHAIISLSANPGATPEAVSLLVAKSSDADAAILLECANLSDTDRAMLVSRWLSGATTREGRWELPAIKSRVGTSPRAQQAALEVLPPSLSRFLDEVRTLDDLGVQRAMADALVRLAPQVTSHSPVVRRAAERLLTRRELDPHVLVTLRPLAVGPLETLRPLMDARAAFNVAEAVRSANCSAFQAGRDDPVHVAQLAALIDLCERFPIDVPATRMASEALAHAHELDTRSFLTGLITSRPLEVPDMFRAFEAQAGDATENLERLADLVLIAGPNALAALENPERVVRIGCQRGWPMLTSTLRVPRSCTETVAARYVPVSELLGDKAFATIVTRRAVGELNASEQEAFWVLLGEWTGSLTDLLEAVRSL